MNEVVLVRLGSRYRDLISWLVWSANTREILARGELNHAGELSLLTSYCECRELIVLAPGGDVILRSLSFPGKINQRTHRALPFLLEDEIATEPENLHMVILAREKSLLHIAAIDREQMRQWLAWLKDAGVTPKCIIPDVLALPHRNDGRWTALQLGNEWLFRQEKWQGTAIDDGLLNEWLLSHPELPLIQSCSPTPDSADDHWQIELCPFPLQLLAENLPDKRIDLLQGEFAPASVWRGRIVSWRVPILLVTALIVMFILNQGVVYIQLVAEQQALQKQMNVLYRQIFPTEKKVINPYVQFNQHLAEASAASSNTNLLSMLSIFGALFDSSSGLAIHAMKYDAATQQLQVHVTGPSFDSIKQIGNKTSAPYPIELRELIERDGSVSGWVMVNGK
ncbi:type II secretion system protein GspL [Yersinia enterocolitica]|uniref:type II secretion system protein GspL n=1 Tax=Yersinia enterocolitica TaxID=630 RepID=UPI0030AAFC40|nr:type II secretion system protein GspL [Yersinia enterocolitica]